jgi:hypothetical protein
LKEIEPAKQLAFEILNDIMGVEEESNELKNEKLNQNEEILLRIFKEHNICCIVDAKSNHTKYTIYGTNENEIQKCQQLLAEINF